MGFFDRLSNPIIEWLAHEEKPAHFPLCDFERIRYELKPCDVILVEGRTRVSQVIKLITQSSWSHAALYIGRLHDVEDANLRDTIAEHYAAEPDTQLLIESELGFGTVIRPLTVYEKDHMRICRPKGLDYKDAQQVLRYAVSRLGSDYDVRQVMDLARFLFPWTVVPRRWRSSIFNKGIGDSTRTVCSTMIAEAFGFIQFPILPLVKKSAEAGVQLFRRNPKLCTPSDFDYSPYFEIIKYPFMDFSNQASYRLLPWHGNGVLTGDEAEIYIGPKEHADAAIQNAQSNSNDGLGKKP